MRIAVVNNFFPPRLGGSSHMSAALAKAYAARGHEVLVLTAAYEGAPAEEVVDGVRIVRLPAVKMPKLGLAIDFDMAFTIFRPGTLRRVFRLLDEFGPDVIHQHGQFFDLSWLTGWYARRRKVPVLLTIHTLLLSPRKLYSTIFKLLDRFVVVPWLRLYKPRFVMLDKLGADYCAVRYKTKPEDYDAFPIPIETGRFDAEPIRDVRADYGIAKDAPLIVSLGHVIPLRDRLPLVEAMPEILAKHPDTRVLVAGRVYYDAFIKRARELGVEDAFIVAGAVPTEDVPSFFAAADLVAHDLTNGCGTASLEAMVAGNPTISAAALDNYPGVDLVNGENFLAITPGDTRALTDIIIGLLDDPVERARIAGSQSRTIRGNFSMDVVVERHLESFARMVGRESRPARAGERKAEPAEASEPDRKAVRVP